MKIIAGICLLGGLFFFLVGTIGILRFRDTFSRMHAASKCDTLGAVLCIVSLIIYKGIDIVSLKLLVVILFFWMSSPTATHMMGKALYHQEKMQNNGVKPDESI